MMYEGIIGLPAQTADSIYRLISTDEDYFCGVYGFSQTTILTFTDTQNHGDVTWEFTTNDVVTRCFPQEFRECMANEGASLGRDPCFPEEPTQPVSYDNWWFRGDMTQ